MQEKMNLHVVVANVIRQILAAKMLRKSDNDLQSRPGMGPNKILTICEAVLANT